MTDWRLEAPRRRKPPPLGELDCEPDFFGAASSPRLPCFRLNKLRPRPGRKLKRLPPRDADEGAAGRRLAAGEAADLPMLSRSTRRQTPHRLSAARLSTACIARSATVPTCAAAKAD